MNWLLIEEIIRRALSEDIGSGDITTALLPDPEAELRAELLCKDHGVLAGLRVALTCFYLLDSDCGLTPLVADGESIEPGQVLAEISGPASAVLVAERVALNFLQRMCGIATVTRRWAELAEPAGIRVVETRKTTPGLRILEKYAVQIGGGYTHRYSLDSAILLKDNHFAAAGLPPEELVALARGMAGHTQKVIAEAGSLAMVAPLATGGADVILLDNFKPSQVREALGILATAERGDLGRVIVEVSGGVNESNLRDYLIEGVDVISAGALTHSVKSLDISLEVRDVAGS